MQVCAAEAAGTAECETGHSGSKKIESAKGKEVGVSGAVMGQTTM